MITKTLLTGYALVWIASASNATQRSQLAPSPTPPERVVIAAPTSFSGHETLIDFDPPGAESPFEDYGALYGVSFELAGGALPTLWVDPRLRTGAGPYTRWPTVK